MTNIIVRIKTNIYIYKFAKQYTKESYIYDFFFWCNIRKILRRNIFLISQKRFNKKIDKYYRKKEMKK